jgi:hypothetical protein
MVKAFMTCRKRFMMCAYTVFMTYAYMCLFYKLWTQ